MFVNFLTSNPSNQTPTPLSVAGDSAPTTLTLQQGFHEILSGRDKDGDRVLQDPESPVVLAVEIPLFTTMAELPASPDGLTFNVAPQPGSAKIAKQVGLSGGTAESEPVTLLGAVSAARLGGSGVSVGGPPHSLGIGDVGQTAKQAASGILPPDGKNLPSLVLDVGSGAESEPAILSDAISAARLDGSDVSVGGQPHSLGIGDVGQAAKQAASGILPPDGKSLPSLVPDSGFGPAMGTVTGTSIDTGMTRSEQQGVLPGDPETPGLTHAKPITDTSVVSVSSQPVIQVPAGTAGGESSPGDNLGDVLSVSVRPTADNMGVVAGVVGDAGKPVSAAAPEAPRQLSWSLDQSIHSPDWENDFGDRILWLANNRQPVAELRLNPPHLGSMEVRIAVQGDQAQVLFHVPGGAVKDAVEAALPRLRDMLTEAGLNLSDVGVSDHPSHGDSHSDGRTAERSPLVGKQAIESDAETAHAEVTAIRVSSQLDLFV